MFNKEELNTLRFDSSKVQRKLIESIENGTDYTLSIDDPTNPFIMLLEATTVLTTNALEEMVNNTARVYPSMSRTAEDLYHHMTDEQEQNMFATPAEAYIRFMLNKNNILENGILQDDGVRYRVIIPKNTEIKVSDVVFTTLNDIDVFILHTGAGKDKSFVEQKPSEDDVNSINSLGNLNSIIITDAENIEWVVFDTKIKQIKRTTFEDNIIKGIDYSIDMPIEHNYYYSDIYIKRNGLWTKVNKVFSDTVLDPNVPSVRIKILEKSVRYEVPSVYVANDSISGLIRIDMFETRGKILMPLDKYDLKDFKVYYANKTETTLTTLAVNQAAAAIKNITTLALSKDILDGGVNIRTHKDIRSKIIHNTTGNIDLPITELQLNEKAKQTGFTLYKALDTITDRIFIAGKNINTDGVINTLPSNIDIFNTQVNLTISEIDDAYTSVKKFQNDLLIKSNTIFESVNGVTKIVNNVIADRLTNAPISEIKDYLKITNFLFTPFYYVLDKTFDVLNSRIYDLDRPELENFLIVNKNINVPGINYNVGTHGIEKIDTGYRIVMKLSKSAPYVGNGELRAQLSIQIPGTLQYTHFDSVVNLATDLVEFRVDTDFYVNDEDYLHIENGDSQIARKLSALQSKAKLIIYVVNDNSINVLNTYEPTNELYFTTPQNNPVAICKETLELTFGDRLRYLWSNINSAYTLRKYRTYPNDVLGIYEENFYNTDPTTGCDVELIDDDGDGDIDRINIPRLKERGDPILDPAGNQITLHRAGDVMLDANGNPTVDVDGGIVRFADILMMQFEYKAVKQDKYKEYVNDTTKLIKSWLVTEMVDLNKITLEHTNILFQAKKSFKDVELVNDKFLTPMIKPSVILYADKDRYEDVYDEYELTEIIGKILHRYMDKKVIEMRRLKDEIMNAIGNGIVGVKIFNSDISEKDIYKLTNSSNRFSVKKIINSYSDVVYDIKISVEKI